MHTQFEDLKKRKRNDDVLRDGEVYRVPLFMMDGVPREMAEVTDAALAEAKLGVIDTSTNQPHYFATQTDAARERRQQLYVNAEAKLCDRWKNPSPLAVDVTKPAAPKPTGDAQQDAYQRYDANISERWRGAA
jgi:hypothetical protein